MPGDLSSPVASSDFAKEASDEPSTLPVDDLPVESDSKTGLLTESSLVSDQSECNLPKLNDLSIDTETDHTLPKQTQERSRKIF